MAKNKQTGISYREHEIKEDHSFGSIGGKTPGVHKRYFCKVVGRTVKGTPMITLTVFRVEVTDTNVHRIIRSFRVLGSLGNRHDSSRVDVVWL